MEVCCDASKVLKSGEYRVRYEAHVPEVEVVEALRDVARPVTVLVVYGLWCKDSARIVPEVLKALAEAGNPQLQLLAVHVAYADTDPSPFMAGPVAVKRYPTVALLAGHYQAAADVPEGAELVRFVEEGLGAGALKALLG